jgi:hypothetical protein
MVESIRIKKHSLFLKKYISTNIIILNLLLTVG